MRAMSLSLNRKIDPGELRHGNIANQEIGRARPDVFQSFQGVGKKVSCVAAALQNQYSGWWAEAVFRRILENSHRT